jgi:hypothetical protein
LLQMQKSSVDIVKFLDHYLVVSASYLQSSLRGAAGICLKVLIKGAACLREADCNRFSGLHEYSCTQCFAVAFSCLFFWSTTMVRPVFIVLYCSGNTPHYGSHTRCGLITSSLLLQ